MKQSYLEIGKIVGSHGIRGMVRIECWCDSPEFLRQFKRFFKEKSLENPINITKIVPHKNIALAKLDGINTIEEAERLRGTVLYIYRDDAKLEKGSYFIKELLGIKVFDKKTNEFYGIIKDVSSTGANDIWYIENNGVEYLFPSVPHFIESIDIESGIAYIIPPKGIFDNEN